MQKCRGDIFTKIKVYGKIIYKSGIFFALFTQYLCVEIGWDFMKVRLKKVAALLLTFSLMLGAKGEFLAVRASGTGTADLVDGNTAAPEPWGALPSPNQYQYQYQYQKEELAAFCHFGPNTYSGYEWGFN